MVLNEYEKQAQDFLGRFNMRFSVKKLETVDHFPDEEDAGYNGLRWKYQFTLKRVNGKRFTFIFYDSISNYMDGVEPTAYDALSCLNLDSYIPDNFQVFCDNAGYNSDSIKANRIYKRVDKFARRINAFFTTEELEALREVN